MRRRGWDWWRDERGRADLRGCVHITGGAQAHAMCNEITVILPRLAPHTDLWSGKSIATAHAEPVRKHRGGCGFSFGLQTKMCEKSGTKGSWWNGCSTVELNFSAVFIETPRAACADGLLCVTCKNPAARRWRLAANAALGKWTSPWAARTKSWFSSSLFRNLGDYTAAL